MGTYLNGDTISGQDSGDNVITWQENKDCYALASVDATLNAYKQKYSGVGEVTKTYNRSLTTPYEYLGSMFECRGANVLGQWIARDTVRFYLLRGETPKPPIVFGNKLLLWVGIGIVVVVVVLFFIFKKK